MSKLILVCGIPGSGKSTWIKNNKTEDEIVISRDEIRFSLLSKEDEYFSQERKVWISLMSNIESALIKNKTVYVDATHLNKYSRLKVLREVEKMLSKPDEIEILFFNVPLEIAIQRNDLRHGCEKVPHEVIKKMYLTLEAPKSFQEGDFIYSNIYIIDENGNKRKVEK